jgi:hypothetical protein
MPLDTLTYTVRLGSGDVFMTKIIRRWKTDEMNPNSGCGRCRCCTAQAGSDGQSMCLVETIGEVPRESRATFTLDLAD